MSYVLPQVQIRQYLTPSNSATIENQNVLVVGPNYQVMSYSDVSDRQKIGVGPYTVTDDVAKIGTAGIDDTVEYGGVETDTSIVTDAVSVVVAGATAAINNDAFGGEVTATLVTNRGATTPDYAQWNADEVDTDCDLGGLYTKSGEVYAKVPAGTQLFTAVTVAEADYVVDMYYVKSADTYELSSDAWSGAAQYYQKATGPFFQLTTETTSGPGAIFVPNSTFAIAFAGAAGDKGTLAEVTGVHRAIVAGDKLVISVSGQPDKVVDIVNVANVPDTVKRYTYSDVTSPGAGEATTTSTKAWYVVVGDAFTELSNVGVSFGEFVGDVDIPSENAHLGSPHRYWEAASDGIVFKAAWEVNDASAAAADNAWLEIVDGTVYISYKALRTVATAGIHDVTEAADIEGALGKIIPQNPLAYGVYKALLNSGDRVVKYIATRGETVSDYEFALGRAELVDDVYMIVPLSEDKGVIDAVKSHVDKMSDAEVKLWRIAFVCPDIPDEVCLWSSANSLNDTGLYVRFTEVDANKGKYSATFYASTTDASPATFTKFSTTVVPGDTLKYDKTQEWGKDVWKTARISQVYNNSMLLVELPEDVTPPRDAVDAEVWHSYDNNERADQVAAICSSPNSRRMYCVFPPTLVDTDGETVPGMFAACAVAGVASSVLPQQPITNVQVLGFQAIPLVYETFTRDQLNKMAEGGAFIVMQDQIGSEIYIRHQISSAAKDNDVLTRELSITKNLDSISYYFAEVFAPYIGKYNITPELIDALRCALSEGLGYLESGTTAGLYGPQILEEGTEIVSIEQMETPSDHVKAKVNVHLPRPFNVFALDLFVI